MARLSSQSDARLLAIGELDAGGLESQNDLRDRVTVRRLVCAPPARGITEQKMRR
jgi:hypothetical protein